VEAEEYNDDHEQDVTAHLRVPLAVKSCIKTNRRGPAAQI
jgi:hypothetical protein